MVEIHTQQGKKGGGKRTYITHGRHTSVIDGDLAGESDHLKTGQAATPYLYGT